MAESYVRFQRGLLSDYKALETKHEDTLYFVHEPDSTTVALYLGGRLITGNGEISGANNLDELNDVLISAVADKDILQYDGTQWKNITFTNLITQIKEQLDLTIDTSSLATKEELNAVSNNLDTEVSRATQAEEDINARIDALDFVDETELNNTLNNYTTIESLEQALSSKADKGTTLADYGITDAYTKEETLNKISEKITEINGGESAGEVLAELNSYKEVNDTKVQNLADKLNGIEIGAQVNIIDSVEEAEFDLVDKHLSLKAMDASKLTGLENHSAITNLATLLNNKVDQTDYNSKMTTIESDIATIKEALMWQDV